jgi:hypothetical protein
MFTGWQNEGDTERLQLWSWRGYNDRAMREVFGKVFSRAEEELI